MAETVSLKKSLGRKEYNKFLDKFLIGGLMQTLRTTSPYEFSVEKAKEITALIEQNKFTTEEELRDQVRNGLGIIYSIKFENGYTLSSFGKFLLKNTEKLRQGDTLEKFLFSQGFRGVPKSYHIIDLDKDIAFMGSELIDIARENGRKTTPKKENLVKTIGRYGSIQPDQEIKKILKEDNYTTYFKEKFIDKLENKDLEEALLQEFSALGSQLDKQRKSVVHNDLHGKNVIKAKDKNSSTKIIDWDSAVIGAIQKDLWRANMSVYQHNCLDRKEERNNSIKTLYDTLNSTILEKTVDKSAFGTYEEFRKNYMITDVLENLNFSQKCLSNSKKLSKKGEDDAAVFFKDLSDLLYTRALDCLDELNNETAAKLEKLGEKNGFKKLTPEERREFEKQQPDRRVGSLIADMEFREDMKDERIKVVTQALNKSRWKKIIRKIGYAVGGVLIGAASLIYATNTYALPALESQKARTFITAQENNKDYDELHEVLISRPEEIEEITKLKGDFDYWNLLESDPNDETEKIFERFRQKRDKIYETIDKEIAQTEDPHKNLLSENVLQLEEREAIIKEFLRILANKPGVIKYIKEQVLESHKNSIKAGLFASRTIEELNFLWNFQNKSSSNLEEKIRKPEDLLAFFMENDANPVITTLLQQAIEKHNNSLVVKYEKAKSLPSGTLDTLIFASMFKSNLHINLEKYARTLGYNTDILKQDEFFVGFLASYAASMLDKYKDLATAITAITNGQEEAEKALIWSKDFFKNKDILDDDGVLAETAWHYFARKNLDSNHKNELYVLCSYEGEREGKNAIARLDTLNKRMEKENKELASLCSAVSKELLKEDKELNKKTEEAVIQTDRQIRNSYESIKSAYENFERCISRPDFDKIPIGQEVRELMPEIRRVMDYGEANMQYNAIMLEMFNELKKYDNLTATQMNEIKQKYFMKAREPIMEMETSGVSNTEMKELVPKIREINKKLTDKK